MSPQASPALKREVPKFAKRTPATAVIGQTADAHPAPLMASANGDNLETRIRARAYELFEQRGAQEGQDLDDWFQAEREILASQSATTP